MNLDSPPKNISCCECFRRIWNWICQIALWICIILIIFAAVGGYQTMLTVSAIVGGVFYLIYIINSLCSPSFSYIMNMQRAQSIHSKMKSLYATPAEITFYVECYHDETRYYTVTNSDGESETRSETIRVTTWRENKVFRYYSWKDISGLFLLDSHQVMRNQKIFIKLKLDLIIDFADSMTMYDYEKEKEDFCEKNRWRDTYMDFSETRSVKGFEKYNLVRISDGNALCINYGIYLFLTFLLPFIQVYKIYLDSFCHHQDYTIKKIISTRYNLNSPQYTEKFVSCTPQIVLFDERYEFHGGSVVQENQPELPTQEELNEAKKYEEKDNNIAITNIPSTNIQSQGLDEMLLVKK